MELALAYLKMDENIKDSIRMIKSMDKGHLHGLMARFTKVAGKMVDSTEGLNSQTNSVNRGRQYGNTASV